MKRVRAMTVKTAKLQDQSETHATRSGELSVDRLPIQKFIWGAGVECSFLPHLNVDQFEWTQHNQFWREDFKRAKDELGINTLRYAFPWHVLESEPWKF